MTSNDTEKKEAIPMGGIASDGTKVKTEKAEKQTLAKPEKSGEPKDVKNPKKKKSAVTIVIITIAALIVVLCAGAGVTFALATSDSMPSAPLVTSDMSTVIKDSAAEMINDKKITFNSEDVNVFLKALKEKYSDKLSQSGVRINDLFAVINDDHATLYCRAVYKGITLPIKAVADISYDDPYIVISFSSVYLGKISLPAEKLVNYLGENLSMDNVSIHNGFIYYDTTALNSKLADAAVKALDLTVDSIEDAIPSEEGNSFFLVDWWKKFTSGISSTIKNWAADIVTDFVKEINFEDAKIIDDEIVIDVSFGDQEDSVSSSDSTEPSE